MIFCTTELSLEDINNLKGQNENRISFITRFGEEDYRLNLVLDYSGIKENDIIIAKFKYKNRWKLVNFYPSIRVRKMKNMIVFWGENTSFIRDTLGSDANVFLTMDWNYLETFRYIYEPDLEIKGNTILWTA